MFRVATVTTMPLDSHKSNTTAMIKADGEAKMTPVNSGIQGTGRRLATVRMIDSVEPFSAGLQVLTIDGWTVVARRGKNFQAQELVLFLEVDAFLPSEGPFASIFSEVGNQTSFNGKTGYRVGTTNFINGRKAKIMSQGYVFKLRRFLNISKEVTKLMKRYATKEELVAVLRTMDIAAQLGISKWESHSEEASNW